MIKHIVYHFVTTAKENKGVVREHILPDVRTGGLLTF